MPPATNTESAVGNSRPTTVSSPAKPPPQGITLPPASIVVLAICIVLVGIMMFYVIYRHFTVKSERNTRRSKKKRHNRAHAQDNTRGDQTALLATTPEKKVPAVSAMHATRTLVATASSKVFCPPVVLQFHIPGTKKTITLYGAGPPSPARNGDKGSPADPRPDVESTKESCVTPFEVPQSPKWPPPIMGRSTLFSPHKCASKSFSNPLKDGMFGTSIQDSGDGNVHSLVSGGDNVRNIRKPLSSKDLTADMWTSKVTSAQQPVNLFGIIRSVSQRMPPRMSAPHVDMPKLPPKALGQENVIPTLHGPLLK